jgi:hypothetical protein
MILTEITILILLETGILYLVWEFLLELEGH